MLNGCKRTIGLNHFLFSFAYFSLPHFLVVVTQVEETSREREERLKAWSSFLVDGTKADPSKADPSKAAEQQNNSTQEAAEPTQQEEGKSESTTKPQEGKDEEEDEEEGEGGIQSTDSSLAGSDEEDA